MALSSLYLPFQGLRHSFRRLFAALLLLGGAELSQGATVGHWRFEGDAAGFVADASGNGRTLTLANGTAAPTQLMLPSAGAGAKFHDPLLQNDLLNAAAASFDGGDRATAADDPLFTSAAFTIEAYVHLTAVGSSTRFIAGHFNSSGSNQRSWALLVPSDGKLSLYLSSNGSGTENLSSNFTLSAGKDYYVAAAINLADTTSSGITFYYQNLTDGGAFQSQTIAHTTTAVLDSSAPFSIGSTANGTSFFTGLIDEVRYSNSRLPITALLAVDPENPPQPPELPDPEELPTADGFRGIWYMNQPTGDQYGYKYSGGMATYPQQHAPIAIYSPAVNKTFFVYGATNPANSTLYHNISYYDHATRRLARPRVLLNKLTDDAHDNPVMSIDDAGYIWIFSNTHGEVGRSSYIHRSVAPYDIKKFEQVTLPTGAFPGGRFAYGNIWWVPGSGFLFNHIRYDSSRRNLYWTTSPNGVAWTTRQALSQMLGGQYQITWRKGNKVGTAFDVHPGGDVNKRTNLYYMETTDLGATWKTADGTPLTTLPLTNVNNPARVLDYYSANPSNPMRVYLKDLAFDANDHPIVLFVESATSSPGPLNPARKVRTIRWTGSEWIARDVTNTDHAYDHGSLYIEPDGTWRVIGTFIDGPQQYGTGGEVGIWISQDQGLTWTGPQAVTSGSTWNHNYTRRPVDAQDDFITLWADGNAFAESASYLYFTDRRGDAVLRMPQTMTGDFAFPEVVRVNNPTGDWDGDGSDNASEFNAGTNPRDSRSVLSVTNLQAAAAGGAGVRISFGTVLGKTYRLMYREALGAGAWLPLQENIAGTGSVITREDPAAPSPGQRFYRIEVTP